MEMIDRYIYAVMQKLPSSQREDIAVELRGLIEDMLEERSNGEAYTAEAIEEVLKELGSPREMAQKYRGTKRYLISPELFDSYVIVLKIVLISMTLSLIAVFAIESIINPVDILDRFIELIVSLVTATPQAFGWVTLVFALVDYSGGFKTEDLKLDKGWSPSKLQPIPHPKKQIKRSEPIVAIVFYVLLMVLFAFSSNFFGVYRFDDGELIRVVPFLNEVSFPQYLPFVLLLLAIFIVKECLKLISAKWTFKLVAYTAIINLFAMVVVYFMITGQAFWNPNFMEELVQSGIVTSGSEGYNIAAEIWENTTRAIVILLLIGLVWDIVAGLIKARKE
ncbi:HAAS signaling domain-containing protein [Ornithinibacillus xuwenensis]|uniref:ABC transporter permease n=1 Tax=Ornithinibacillus xuwenensis TaxID=3144668 RepID=A0ABU9XKZ3_9BACI